MIPLSLSVMMTRMCTLGVYKVFNRVVLSPIKYMICI